MTCVIDDLLRERRAGSPDGLALDVGCELTRAEAGAIGMDRVGSPGVEVVWDVDDFPWPFPDGTFARVHMSHIIEHVESIIDVLREVHRVSCAGGDLFVTTPHYSSHNSYTDPTHKHHLAAATFEYFTDRSFATFVGPGSGFQLVHVKLTFGGNFVLDGLGRWLARRNLKWYERHAAWVFPALDIRAHLRVVK